MAEAICERLRFSKADTAHICWLVGQHMRLATAKDMRESKRRRLVREEGFEDLLALCRADCLSSHRNPEHVDWVANYKANLRPEEIRPEPLLRGDDLIAMGYAPGPLFAVLLRAVEDAQLEGTLRTADEARDFVRAQAPELERFD
jgi:poly(A) polymerase